MSEPIPENLNENTSQLVLSAEELGQSIATLKSKVAELAKTIGEVPNPESEVKEAVVDEEAEEKTADEEAEEKTADETIFNFSTDDEKKAKGEGEVYGSLEVCGGTFTTNPDVHRSLKTGLQDMFGEGITGAGNVSVEVAALEKIGHAAEDIKSNLKGIEDSLVSRLTNLQSLKNVMNTTIDKLVDVVKVNDTNGTGEANARIIKDVHDKLNDEFNNQMKNLQTVLNLKLKPTSDDLMALIKDNNKFQVLAERLGVNYNTPEASDRLALAYTNMSKLQLNAKKVEDALKTLEISLDKYKSLKTVEELKKVLSEVLKNNTGKSSEVLSKVLSAIKTLKGTFKDHSKLIKELRGAMEDAYVDGGDYSTGVGRVRSTTAKSTLKTRVKTYENTLKELFKNFIGQMGANFSDIKKSAEAVTSNLGNDITYDDDIKQFISIFESFTGDLNNGKLFYSLISLDQSMSGKELKNRFMDNLKNLIESLTILEKYSYLGDIKKQLLLVKENIDTYSDTVLSVRSNEENLKSGRSEFSWSDGLVDPTIPAGVANTIKETIVKLRFFGNLSMIKENMNRVSKEYPEMQNGYDKLLGKSIGTKLSELQKEYTEAVDRLNDTERGRGFVLDRYNKNNQNAQIPKGLVETLYKLQYEAKVGLYKTVEAVDLYLMKFTEFVSKDIEALKELNSLLSQTELISAWSNTNSITNIDSLFAQITPDVNRILRYEHATYLGLNRVTGVDTFKTGEAIRKVLESSKKSIESVAVLRNIIAMFAKLGDKFGDVSLSKESYMSPGTMYNNLVKYIWVSAYTMGYGTAGGDKNAETGGKTDKNGYEPEKGDKAYFFDLRMSLCNQPLDILGAHEKALVNDIDTILARADMAGNLADDADSMSGNEADARRALNALAALGSQNDFARNGMHLNNIAGMDVNERNSLKRVLTKFKQDILNKDIFRTEDKYFILSLKAISAKVLTVVGISNMMTRPSKVTSMITNPVRTIMGASEAEVADGAVELYIRLPLLLEFYKHIFHNGNEQFKKNNVTDGDRESIAFIPEVGSVWSGLIQCIFDDSKQIDNGIYSVENMKRIINEVNKIYKNYSGVEEPKLARTVVLDLISEVNRRYGVLKRSEIAEFYQSKKKYHSGMSDLSPSANDYDILDAGDEDVDLGPSSEFTSNSINLSSNKSKTSQTDIQIVKEFRDLISKELHSTALQALSDKSFSERVKYFKNEVKKASSQQAKVEIIIKAIDDSSNINSHNGDVVLLYHELIRYPLTNIQTVYRQQIDAMIKLYSAIYSTLHKSAITDNDVDVNLKKGSLLLTALQIDPHADFAVNKNRLIGGAATIDILKANIKNNKLRLVLGNGKIDNVIISKFSQDNRNAIDLAKLQETINKDRALLTGLDQTAAENALLVSNVREAEAKKRASVGQYIMNGNKETNPVFNHDQLIQRINVVATAYYNLQEAKSELINRKANISELETNLVNARTVEERNRISGKLVILREGDQSLVDGDIKKVSLRSFNNLIKERERALAKEYWGEVEANGNPAEYLYNITNHGIPDHYKQTISNIISSFQNADIAFLRRMTDVVEKSLDFYYIAANRIGPSNNRKTIEDLNYLKTKAYELLILVEGKTNGGNVEVKSLEGLLTESNNAEYGAGHARPVVERIFPDATIFTNYYNVAKNTLHRLIHQLHTAINGNDLSNGTITGLIGVLTNMSAMNRTVGNIDMANPANPIDVAPAALANPSNFRDLQNAAQPLLLRINQIVEGMKLYSSAGGARSYTLSTEDAKKEQELYSKIKKPEGKTPEEKLNNAVAACKDLILLGAKSNVGWFQRDPTILDKILDYNSSASQSSKLTYDELKEAIRKEEILRNGRLGANKMLRKKMEQRSKQRANEPYTDAELTEILPKLQAIDKQAGDTDQYANMKLFFEIIKHMRDVLPANVKSTLNNSLIQSIETNITNLCKNYEAPDATTGPSKEVNVITRNLISEMTRCSCILSKDKLVKFVSENFSNSGCAVKFITGEKYAIDYSKLQTMVENNLESVKYFLSKMRNKLSNTLISNAEKHITNLENNYLNKFIYGQDTDIYTAFELINFDSLNVTLSNLVQNSNLSFDKDSLYTTIVNENLLRCSEPNPSMHYNILKETLKTYNNTDKQWKTYSQLGKEFNVISDVFAEDLHTKTQGSLLFKFNNLVARYLNTFFEVSSKKFYTGLVTEFSKTQNAAINGGNGMADAVKFMQLYYDSKIFPQNDNVLSETLGFVIKTFTTRTQNKQLQNKYHAQSDISEVSSNMIEKYKTYLPVFISLFEKMIEYCLLHKKMLEMASPSEVNGNEDDSPLRVTKFKYLGDEDAEELSTLGGWVTGDKQAYSHYNNILNNIVSALRSLVNDASVVLKEVDYSPQFFETKSNSIKNFYSNINKLPVMPNSILSTELINKYNSMPKFGSEDNVDKLWYGLNYVLNNKTTPADLNKFVWMKEFLVSYNSSTSKIDNIDLNSISKFLEATNSVAKLVYENEFLNKSTTDNTLGIVGMSYDVADPADGNRMKDPCRLYTYYSAMGRTSSETISITENSSIESNKKLITDFLGTNTANDFSREKARLMNIIDMNVSPINPHALMREIPLINVYNYAFTFDDIVSKDFGVKSDDLYRKAANNSDDLVISHKNATGVLLLDPYYAVNRPLADVTNVADNGSVTVQFNDAGDLVPIDLTHGKKTMDVLKSSFLNALPKDANNNVSFGFPKYAKQIVEKCSHIGANNLGAREIKNPEDASDLRFNNKFTRNLLFLTNLHRYLLFKIKNEVERIDSKKVSSSHILSDRITSSNNGNVDDSEFDYLML